MNNHIFKNLKKSRKELSFLNTRHSAKQKSAFYNHNDFSAEYEQKKVGISANNASKSDVEEFKS